MKRASEVKRSVRCSEESVAGDGSMCAAVGVNKCSPKLLAADGTMRGVGITKKRPRKADKPSKKEERLEKIEEEEEEGGGGGQRIRLPPSSRSRRPVTASS